MLRTELRLVKFLYLKQRKEVSVMSKPINKVTKQQCLDAIDYLFTAGFTLEMTRDKRYYTEVLLKKVANVYNIELKGIDDE